MIEASDIVSGEIKPYSKFTGNIYDHSHTGGSKTTRAIEFIRVEIASKRPVIVVMQGYESLDSVYLNRYVPPTHLVIKGKTQEGMCDHYERYSDLYKFIRPPHECLSCPKIISCKYQEQRNQLNTFFSSPNDGFVLFTTPFMLDNILTRCKTIQPTIIIDDVPLSEVVTKETSDDRQNLEGLKKECESELFFEHLPAIAQMLIDGKTSEDILTYIRSNKDAVKNELNEIQKKVYQTPNGNLKRAKYGSLFTLLDAVSCDNLVDIFYDKHGIYDNQNGRSGRINIVVTKKSIQKHRIIYLNASCNYIDEYYIKRLGNFEEQGAEALDNPDFFVFQVTDAKYSKSSIVDSPVIVEKVTAICEVFN